MQNKTNLGENSDYFWQHNSQSEQYKWNDSEVISSIIGECFINKEMNEPVNIETKENLIYMYWEMWVELYSK